MAALETSFYLGYFFYKNLKNLDYPTGYPYGPSLSVCFRQSLLPPLPLTTHKK